MTEYISNMAMTALFHKFSISLLPSDTGLLLTASLNKQKVYQYLSNDSEDYATRKW
jgi:hypothetical protein